MSKTPLFAFLLISLVAPLSAGTYTAASCNLSDVNAVINGPTHTVVDGDVIVIPVGSCTWATSTVYPLQVPTGIGITITGVGNPTSDPTVIGADPSCGQTAITLVVAAEANTRAFRMTPSFGSSTARISCMAINYGSGPAVAISVLGSCTTSGCPNIRWDNLTFNNWMGHVTVVSYGLAVVDNAFGVIDHNTLNGNPAVNQYLQLAMINHGHYLGVGGYGDNAWAQPAGFGSANWLFVENNVFVNAGVMDNEGNASSGGDYSTQGGGKVVVRFNNFQGMQGQPAITWHGTETNGRPRGGRAWEFYGNTYTCNLTVNVNCPIAGPRSGTGYTWGNNIIQAANLRIGSFWMVSTYRMFANIGVWSACDGTTVWDTNDGVVYFSGTVASITPATGSAQGPTITVAGTDPGWTTNQWATLGAPHSFHDVRLNNGTEIISNGSNTLVIQSGGSSPGGWVQNIAVGDSIQITRATVCMDAGGGRGAGFAFIHSTSPMTPAMPANQVPEPMYFWMNSFSPGGPQNNVTAYRTLRTVGGRDWYTETINQAAQSSPTSPFDGTAPALGAQGGVGHGTLANRPTTCAVNTAYFATDQGNWNHAPGGTQGQLYICAATNTWTLYYTPYTYPHPLVQGIGTTRPVPPTNLVVTAADR